LSDGIERSFRGLGRIHGKEIYARRGGSDDFRVSGPFFAE